MRVFVMMVVAAGLAVAQQPGELSSTPPQEGTDSAASQPGTITLPAGTQVPLRLAQALSTKNAKVGDAVYAETAFPITQNDRTIIPAGTFVQGRISELRRPGRARGRAEVLMHFTTLIYRNGYTVMLPGGVENMPGSENQRVKDTEGTVQQNPTKGKDAATVGKTAATGAGIGAVVDRGVKGAGIGGGIGAGVGLATVLLTRGPDITLPAGTSVQMVLQRPLILKESKIR